MSRYLWVLIVLLVGPTTSGATQQAEPLQASPQQTSQPASTQQTSQPGSTRPASAPPAPVNLSEFSMDYQVGAGDLLAIDVIGQGDLKQSLRVSNSGEISMPMLGLVRVADLTAFEIEEKLAGLLQDKGLIKSPEVLVFVQEFQAKPIYVMGAVTTAGGFVMSQTLTMVDAILMAGGLRFTAADEALIYRRGSSPEGRALSPEALAANPGADRPGVEVLKVDLKPLKQGRFHESAVPLRAGDVVMVPDQLLKQFFVVGDVMVPRNYAYPFDRVLMASQAISFAGGPTPTAKLSEGMLVRYDDQGQRNELKVDWGAILRGEEQDFPVQANDIIFVPGSVIKTIARGMLNVTSGMIGAAAFRIGRTYQLPDAPQNPGTPPPQQ
jgi:polysaccharide export outer membrane protein